MHRLKSRLRKLAARIDVAPSWVDYFARAERLARTLLSSADPRSCGGCDSVEEGKRVRRLDRDASISLAALEYRIRQGGGGTADSVFHECGRPMAVTGMGANSTRMGIAATTTNRQGETQCADYCDACRERTGQPGNIDVHPTRPGRYFNRGRSTRWRQGRDH